MSFFQLFGINFSRYPTFPVAKDKQTFNEKISAAEFRSVIFI